VPRVRLIAHAEAGRTQALTDLQGVDGSKH